MDAEYRSRSGRCRSAMTVRSRVRTTVWPPSPLTMNPDTASNCRILNRRCGYHFHSTLIFLLILKAHACRRHQRVDSGGIGRATETGESLSGTILVATPSQVWGLSTVHSTGQEKDSCGRRNPCADELTDDFHSSLLMCPFTLRHLLVTKLACTQMRSIKSASRIALKRA